MGIPMITQLYFTYSVNKAGLRTESRGTTKDEHTTSDKISLNDWKQPISFHDVLFGWDKKDAMIIRIKCSW